ncbi:MAG: ABC transporter ATP-binding protein [Coprobacillaceae bacterium]
MKKYLIKNKGLFLVTVIFSLLASTSLVLVTRQYEWMFDAASSGDISKFVPLIIVSAIFIVTIFVLFFLYLLCSKRLIKNILFQMREDMFDGILTRDMSSFYKENTSEYISVLTNDINLLEENWLKPVLGICESAGKFIATVGMLLFYSPLITIVIFIASAIGFLIPMCLGKYLSKRQKMLSKELAYFTNKIKDIFSGFEVIYSFNMTNHITRNFKTYNQQLANRKYQTDQFKVINDIIAQMLGIFIQVGTTGLCAYLVMRGDIAIGVLAAIVQLCSSFTTPLMQIMNHSALMKSMKPIINKIDKASKIEPKQSGKAPSLTSQIKISNLNFGYDDKKIILKDINLNIDSKKKYAIMGSSGCGKSTLVKLLLGYYSNFEGSIQYDNENIQALDLHQLHEMASIIQQNVYMFDETIKENICLHQTYPDDVYQEAINASGCQNIITPDFTEDTLVGENGSRLSGGQKQRIALARALIRKKSLLILDEGTSAVDVQGANDIEGRLLENEDLTLLSILHRTSEELLQKYDEVIYMDKGKIIEKGSFNTLINNQGAFYNFYTVSNKNN